MVLVDQQPSLFVMLIGLVLAGAIPFAFLMGFRRGIAALILIRPLCDRLFSQAALTSAAMHSPTAR